jgi:hypothetical protein
MMKVNNKGAALEQFYKDLNIVLKEPKTKASSKAEALKAIEYNYGVLLDPKSQNLMKQVIKIYQDLASLEMADQVDKNTVKKILDHIKIWNGAPIDGMIEFIMSGRDCDSLQMNLENYPYNRDDTFAYISEDLIIQCW